MALNTFRRLQLSKLTTFSRLLTTSVNNTPLTSEYGRKMLFPGIPRLTEMVMKKANGSYLYSDDGKEYLDFVAGFAVTSTGHCHPHVVKAIQAQAEEFLHAQFIIGYQKPMLQLISRWEKYLPSELNSFFFWNSGAEGVEAAIKTARAATKKTNIIAFQGAYHGRTYGTMGISTSKINYSVGFGPFPGGIHIAPFPYASQLPKGLDEKDISDYCIEQFELMLKQQTHPSDTAAVIIEPVLGEGGYVPAPLDFLPRLKEICQKNGILLIFDEVQCGYGRTGKMFAFEHYGVVPDIMVLAKGIASGLPISAVITRSELTKNQFPGSFGGTYSGNIISCAAANATLDVFEKENLIKNTEVRGKQMMDKLREFASNSKYHIKDVRGLGLMVAVEFGDVKPGTAYEISKGMLDEGLLVTNCSAFEVLRFSPALNVNEEQTNKALSIFKKVLDKHSF